MYDLIVIGGGFWGTAAAVLAREAGLDTLLLDDAHPQGASRNAAGIITLGWYKSETVSKIIKGIFTPQDAVDGLRWLTERGFAHQTGEEFYPLWGQYRFRQDCYLTMPAHILGLGQPLNAAVQKLVKGQGYWVVLTETRELLARCVILAAGAFTDTLLEASGLPPVGVKPLRGRALILKTSHRSDAPITAQVAPYTHYTTRPWMNNTVRLGDTVEKLANTESGLAAITAYGNKLLPDMEIAATLDGYRPVRDKMFVEEIAPGLVVATGGHRVGLALAPSAARKALALLGVVS